jgi:transketolase
MALAGRMDRRDYRVFVLMGDGETHEGSVWEAAAAAAKYKLGNLVGIIDANRLCVDGDIEDVMPMEPMAEKWKAFGWRTVEVDGHDLGALVEVLDVPREGSITRQPAMIIARTIKGRGISFMENVRSWHSDSITLAQHNAVMAELAEPLS